MFKPNVGKTDRIIRVIAGLALLTLVFTVEGTARWFGLVGLVPLLTGIVGFCPAYTLCGCNTCGCCKGKSGEEGQGGGCCMTKNNDTTKPEDQSKGHCGCGHAH